MPRIDRHRRPGALIPRILVLLLSMPLMAAPPDPRALLARAKEAAGGRGWDSIRRLRVEVHVRTAGLEGTASSLSDLTTGSYVSRYDLGVARGAQGFDGTQPWSQDSSGDVVAQDARGQLEASRSEAYRTALAYWYPDRWPAEIVYMRHEQEDGRGFHVLGVDPEGGRPFELWLDGGTLLVSRTVERGATDITTTRFSDYREVDGIRLPFRVHTSTGEPGSEVDVEVTAIQLNPEVPESGFAPPAVRVDDFSIAEDRSSVTLPFELLNNHIYVMASVNGSPPRRFLVDTGGVNLITRRTAEQLGIGSEGALPVSGAGEGQTEAGMTTLQSFGVGEVTFRRPVFLVIPLDGVIEAEGVEFSGLVGFEVFRRFVVTIDYATSRLTLSRPESFRYDGPGVRVPFRYDGHTPVVDGAIDGRDGAFSIDTGSRSTLSLHAPFVQEHDLATAYAADLEALTGWGVGGGVRSRVSRARSLKLGEMEVPDVVVELTAQEKGAFTDRYLAGNVGGGVLKRFTVIFHYGDQVMILEPNRTFDDPDGFDRSGMWVNHVGGAFQVEGVVEGGPAAAAGLAVGDRVTAIDGRPVSDVRLPDLRQRFRTEPPGTEISLTVEGTGGGRSVTLVLRDLF